MKLAEFSVKNSLFVNLFTLFLLGVGIFVLFQMPLRVLPPVHFGIVTVSTTWAGAPAEEVERLVTIPLEKELRGVGGIKEIRSSSAENLSSIIITTPPDVENEDKVVDDIRRAVDRVRNLPEGAGIPEVWELEVGEVPVIQVFLGGQLSERELQRYAKSLRDRLEEVEEVSRIDLYGLRDEEIRVEVYPQKLREYHLSLEEIASAIHRQNVDIPAGTMVLDERDLAIRTRGRFKTTDEIEGVVIRASEVGAFLEVRDVAQVRRAFEEEEIINRVMGTRATSLIVIMDELGDAVDVVANVRQVTEEFKEHASAELEISFVDDFSLFIQQRLGVLEDNAWFGVILVFISLFIFLNRRVALVTALGLPTAFLATFIIMEYMGATINLISMFGLVIVLGMLVDDGIIVSENAYRHMEKGMTPREAAIIGSNEVVKPVIATVLTTIAAFSPLFFMPGITGKFVREIPLVVIIALAASLLQAFIILPAHLASFVRIKKGKSGKILSKTESLWFKKLVNGYTYLLRKAVKKRYLMILLMVILFIFFIFIAKNIPLILFPPVGIEHFYVRAETSHGTPVEKTGELIRKIESLIKELPVEELNAFVTQVGMFFTPPDFHPQRGSHLTQIAVYLTPAGERKRDAFEIKESIREKAKGIQGFENIHFELAQPGPPVGDALTAHIRGRQLATLRKIAGSFKDFIKTIDGAKDLKYDYQPELEQIEVIVDSHRAKWAHLSVAEIASTIHNAFSGRVATSIKEGEEEIDVVVSFAARERERIETFQEILIPNRFGNLIPLSEVARIEKSMGITAINRVDGKRAITITASVNPKKISSIELNRLVAQQFEDIEVDFPDYSVRYGGEYEETREALTGLLQAFAVASFLIFMILATNFKSLAKPLVIMLAIPFGFIGVTITLLLHGEPFSYMTLLGAVALSGVVVNNSIVFVDFIDKLRQDGAKQYHSIIEAGRLRLRPIILTTITTFLGLIPVAYGIGGGDPFLQPTALVIIWGLLFAAIMTLFATPCVYAVIDDLTMFLRRKHGQISIINKNS